MKVPLRTERLESPNKIFLHCFVQMEKIFSHAWRGRHGTETEENLEHLTEQQTSPEDIQIQYVDDDQV